MADSLHDPRQATIIEMLIAARKSAGLTQRDLAARLKQQQSYVAKIETRQRRMDVVELIDILDAIGVKPTSFVSDALKAMRRRN